MKPIIIDMKEMSDSTEVYESRPNPFFIVFIYLFIGILAVALIWMYFWKLDIVVKGNGTFAQEQTTKITSSSVTGKIAECNLKEGVYVHEGELLLSVEHEKEDEQLSIYEGLLGDVDDRILMMKAYMKYLDSDEQDMEQQSENPYYQEFANRAKLLQINQKTTTIGYDNQILQYEQSVTSITNSVNYYEKQRENYVRALENVKAGKNTFVETDVYFYSLIENYLVSCKAIESKYDAASLSTMQDAVAAEKNTALNNLAMEQIAGLEQQITSIDGNLTTLNGNLDAARAQVTAAQNGTGQLSSQTTILTEKNTITAEISTYESKKKEYESEIQSLKDTIAHCNMKAESDGYISVLTQLEAGSYVQEGMNVFQILPENVSEYQAEIYISNQDIGKVQEGQKVKFEIAAYPSSEYGYFTGIIETVSKDIKVDQNTGSAYYLAKVRCDKTTLANENGDSVSIMNGMACQARIVTDEQSVLKYVLRKINVLGK